MRPCRTIAIVTERARRSIGESWLDREAGDEANAGIPSPPWPSLPSYPIESSCMTSPPTAPAFPFEIHHGGAVVAIADDWSGHVLIEQIYEGLRRARRSRDAAHLPPTPPDPDGQAETAMVEMALLHGFRPLDETGIYQATASEIAALILAAREQGRMGPG